MQTGIFIYILLVPILFRGDFGPTIHTSLSRNISLNMEIDYISHYRCVEAEVLWQIERADGEAEVYIIRNHTYNGIFDTFPDRGISLTIGCCLFYCLYCANQLTITPTDMRYDGAQITGVVNLPECFSAPNTTITTTLRIQDLLEAPTHVSVKAASTKSVVVSWSPPPTLDGIPILHYSVYITSEGLTEQINTTETHITMGRPCSNTTYQISTWNEVGEGNTSVGELSAMSEVDVDNIEEKYFGLVCISCTFFVDSIADSCALKNTTDNAYFVLLECITRAETSTINNMYEIKNSLALEYTTRNVCKLTLSPPPHNSTLLDSDVDPVIGGICASCVFTSNSTARGCAVKLHNDQCTFNFSLSLKSTKDIAISECFKLPKSGSFHVLVSEMKLDGSLGHNALKLPDITITGLGFDNTNETDCSLIHSDVEPIVGGICASCVFARGSIASGCTVELYNDQYNFSFSISRELMMDIAIMECFEVPKSDLFHVQVSKLQKDGHKMPLELPDITIERDSDKLAESDNSVISDVIEHSIIVCLALIVLVLTIAIATVLVWRKLNAQNPVEKNGSNKTTNSTSNAVANYEDVELPHQPTSAPIRDNMYEEVELASTTGQEKEIEVEPNAAYGTAQRSRVFRQ